MVLRLTDISTEVGMLRDLNISLGPFASLYRAIKAYTKKQFIQ